MNKLFVVLGIGLLLLQSCNNENDFSQEINGKDNGSGKEPVEVATGITLKDGFLHFASEDVLESFLLGAEQEADAATELKSTRASTTRLNGFVSLADMKQTIGNSLKSTRSSDVDEDEEMTEDEVRIVKAEELLVDPILAEVVDTTLRIGVSDRIYKITEYGTFSAPTNNAHFIEQEILHFDKSLITSTELGTYVNLENGVVFTNSFGQEGLESYIEEVPETRSSLKSADVYQNDFHNGYNVNTHRWKNNSVWQKFWDKIRGKDVSKENYFGSKKRVQVNVFNVNYAFYASSGIKVKMQKRKRVAFVKWWVSTDADKLAVGFNKVYGEMKYTNPRSFSSISPTASGYWGRFTGTLNGIGSNFVLTQYKKFDLVKDWVDDIYMFLPEVEIKGNVYPNQSHMNKLYEVPADQVFSFLKSQANRVIYNPIEKRIKPKDPRMAYLVWGNTTQSFDKDKSYIMGVQEYGRQSGKSVRFDRSFGFNINNGKVSGFTPTEFKIKSIDAFGAAYYDGQWRGVRFID